MEGSQPHPGLAILLSETQNQGFKLLCPGPCQVSGNHHTLDTAGFKHDLAWLSEGTTNSVLFLSATLRMGCGFISFQGCPAVTEKETSRRLWLELPIVRAAHLLEGARSLAQPVSQFVDKYKQGIMVGV